MTNERHEKALEAGLKASGMEAWDHIEIRVRDFMIAYLQAMDAVIVQKEPVGWRYRFNGVPSRKWTVQKNGPDWYNPTMPDVELEPLFAPSPNHFTNGE